MEPTGDQSTLTMSACRESASLIAFFAPTAMAATASVLSPCGHKRLYLCGTGILFEEPNPTGSRPSDLFGLEEQHMKPHLCG